MDKKIVRFRHVIISCIVRPFFFIALKCLYNFKRLSRGPKYPCVIIANHNCNLDPVFVGCCFWQPVYYVASDHIFRKGIISKLLTFAVAPIPIVKSQMDSSTIRTMLKVRDQGGSLCLFPEGNRSFSGETGFIPPSTCKLIKMLKMPLCTMSIQGGYLSTPRWADHHRKGRITIEVVRTIPACEIEKMSLPQIQQVILQDLHVSAYETQRTQNIPFKGKLLAQGLERALFVCPKCRGLNTLKSRDDNFYCSCGFETKYSVYGYFDERSPFKTVTQWYDFQKDFVFEQVQADAFNSVDPIFSDGGQSLYVCSRARQNQLYLTGTLIMYSDRLVFDGDSKQESFALCDISKMIVHGSATLQFTVDGILYEIHSNKVRSALKYMALYYLLTSKKEGANNGFIGI